MQDTPLAHVIIGSSKSFPLVKGSLLKFGFSHTSSRDFRTPGSLQDELNNIELSDLVLVVTDGDNEELLPKIGYAYGRNKLILLYPNSIPTPRPAHFKMFLGMFVTILDLEDALSRLGPVLKFKVDRNVADVLSYIMATYSP